ncbi:MAG: hypothetical protein IKM18_05660, partial [Clostridia bacterium]|nr:hypothetical protein [Clostridia bacterium]
PEGREKTSAFEMVFGFPQLNQTFRALFEKSSLKTLKNFTEKRYQIKGMKSLLFAKRKIKHISPIEAVNHNFF